MATLSELKEQVEKLAEGAQEPEDMCWFYHDEFGESEANYCPGCAEAMYNWLLGGAKPEQLDLEQESSLHPLDWHGRTSEDVLQLLRDNGQEVETPEFCALCGTRLSITLLEGGAHYEVDHFEWLLGEFQSGLSPDEWFAVLEMVEAIEHVEADWFPNRWMRPYEVEAQRKTYGRVLATVEGLLKLTQP